MQAPNTPPVPVKTPGHTFFRTVLWVLLLTFCGLVLCHLTVLKVRTVNVEGNHQVSREEIIRLAGFNRTVSILNIREKDVRAGIDSHARLTFEKLEYTGINSLTIHVTERIPMASCVWKEKQYLLDQTGMVLETLEDTDYDRGVMVLSGLNMKRLQTGEVLTPVSVEQLLCYQAVMEEMNRLGIASHFSELNITHTDHMYLVSMDGYAIDIGDKSEMLAKLFTVMGVLEEVRRLGYAVGSLDATVPGYCVYSPPQQ